MKTTRTSRKDQNGGSVVDLLVIVVVIVGTVGLLIPRFGSRGCRSQRISCVNNLKQVATGLRLFANDNDGKYPLELIKSGVPKSTGDSSVTVGWNENPTNLWKLFQFAQNDLSSPRILACPADTQRFPAQDFLTNATNGYSTESFSHPSKRNNALSYFLALDAKEAWPTSMLVGDRNLARDPDKTDSEPGRNYLTGEQRLGSTEADVKHLRWNDEIHKRAGNIAFMDGSAQQLTSGKLRDAVMNTGDPTNRIWLPQ